MSKPSDPHTLLTSSLALGAMGVALADGSAAMAKTDGAKAQADALRAAASLRQNKQQPATVSVEAQYDNAKMRLAGGDVAGAMAGFRRVLAAEPQSVDAMNGLAISYDRMGRYDVARGWYEAALAVQPDAAAVLTNLGYSLYLQQQYRVAIPFLQAAVRSNDPRAAATAQRLLSQISARLTAEAAAAPLVFRPAEIALVTTPQLGLRSAAPSLQPAQMAAATVPVETATNRQPAAPMPVSIAAAPAPVSAPAPEVASSARIELAANGEARLMLGAAAPAPVLVEALGNAAALVLVADTWTAQDDVRLERQVFAEQKAEDQAASQARRLRSETVQMVALAAPLAQLVMVEAPALRLDRPLVAAVTLAAAPLAAAPSFIAPAYTETAAENLATTLAQAPSAPAAITALAPAALAGELQPAIFASALKPPVARTAHAVSALRPAPQMLVQSTGWQNPDGSDALPAWLISPRRAAPASNGAPTAPLSYSATDGSVLAFESDDATLNSFAARYRASSDDDSPAARQAAIARLQDLIARVRAA